MPTKLNKRVVRETRRTMDRSGRALVVALEPSEVISFRPKGSKKTVSVHIGHVYNLAKIFAARDHYNERMARYQQRKKLGQKTKRPKMSTLPYSKFYYDAITK